MRSSTHARQGPYNLRNPLASRPQDLPHNPPGTSAGGPNVHPGQLLDKNDNDAQNLEEIEELQSELNSIDAKKEREFLSLKSSWDILEKEKSRREFIKLESLRAGYHDPTIMRIYVKKIDMTLPAPHEK